MPSRQRAGIPPGASTRPSDPQRGARRGHGLGLPSGAGPAGVGRVGVDQADGRLPRQPIREVEGEARAFQARVRPHTRARPGRACGERRCTASRSGVARSVQPGGERRAGGRQVRRRPIRLRPGGGLRAGGRRPAAAARAGRPDDRRGGASGPGAPGVGAGGHPRARGSRGDASQKARAATRSVVPTRMDAPVRSCQRPSMSTPALASSVRRSDRRKFIAEPDRGRERDHERPVRAGAREGREEQPATVQEMRLRTPLQASLTPTLVRASSITFPSLVGGDPEARSGSCTTPTVTSACRKTRAGRRCPAAAGSRRATGATATAAAQLSGMKRTRRVGEAQPGGAEGEDERARRA
jgi:hypothetical protein